MKVLYYYNQTDLLNGTGSIIKFVNDLEKKRPDLFALVITFLQNVSNSVNLEMFKRQKLMGTIKGKEPIYEFKIPPTKKGGVVRLYFSYIKNDKTQIYILSAELKHDKEPDPEKIKLARRRYKEVCV